MDDAALSSNSSRLSLFWVDIPQNASRDGLGVVPCVAQFSDARVFIFIGSDDPRVEQSSPLFHAYATPLLPKNISAVQP